LLKAIKGYLKITVTLFIVLALITACLPEDENDTQLSEEPIKQEQVVQENSDEKDAEEEPIVEVQKQIRGNADADLESMDYLLYYLDSNGIVLHDFEADAANVERKILELKENDKNRYYVRMKDGVWERTFSESPYGYIGELKDDKPTGVGMIVDLRLFYSYDMEFIHYIGEFAKGRYDGYGQVYNTPSEDLVSMYYGYVSNEKLNSALNYLMYSGEFDDGELSGLGNYFIYTPDDNLLAYYNVSPVEATMEALLEISEKNGVYGMFKESIEDYYKDVPFSFDKVDIPLDMFYKNIKIIVGKFTNNDLNGDVKIYCYGKLLYDGGMKNGLYDGYGTLYYYGSNRKYYQGNFAEGEFTDSGKIYSLDGDAI